MKAFIDSGGWSIFCDPTISSTSFFQTIFNVLSTLSKEIFAVINVREFFSGHFAGINFRELSSTKDFVGINFRELGLIKDFTGINFRERNLYKYFEGINFACTLKEYFSTTLVYGF